MRNMVDEIDSFRYVSAVADQENDVGAKEDPETLRKKREIEKLKIL